MSRRRRRGSPKKTSLQRSKLRSRRRYRSSRERGDLKFVKHEPIPRVYYHTLEPTMTFYNLNCFFMASTRHLAGLYHVWEGGEQYSFEMPDFNPNILPDLSMGNVGLFSIDDLCTALERSQIQHLHVRNSGRLVKYPIRDVLNTIKRDSNDGSIAMHARNIRGDDLVAVSSGNPDVLLCNALEDSFPSGWRVSQKMIQLTYRESDDKWIIRYLPPGEVMIPARSLSSYSLENVTVYHLRDPVPSKLLAQCLETRGFLHSLHNGLKDAYRAAFYTITRVLDDCLL